MEGELSISMWGWEGLVGQPQLLWGGAGNKVHVWAGEAEEGGMGWKDKVLSLLPGHRGSQEEVPWGTQLPQPATLWSSRWGKGAMETSSPLYVAQRGLQEKRRRWWPRGKSHLVPGHTVVLTLWSSTVDLVFILLSPMVLVGSSLSTPRSTALQERRNLSLKS